MGFDWQFVDQLAIPGKADGQLSRIVRQPAIVMTSAQAKPVTPSGKPE